MFVSNTLSRACIQSNAAVRALNQIVTALTTHGIGIESTNNNNDGAVPPPPLNKHLPLMPGD
jgi:hypothetical protein